MAFLSILPPLPAMTATLIDSVLLVALIVPFMYFLIYRPMAEQISKLRSKDEELGEMAISIEEIKTRFIEYDLILRTTSESILRIDTEGTIHAINDVGVRMFGYENGELEGKNLSVILPHDSPEALLRGYELFLDGWDEAVSPEPHAMEGQALTRDGRSIQVELSISDCMIDLKTYYIIIIREITKRKLVENALRESEEKYRSLFVNMLSGYTYCKMIFDENNQPVDWIYLEVNDAFEKLTGLSRKDVVGKRATDAIPGIKNFKPDLFEIYGKVAATCEGTSITVFFDTLDLWLTISLYCPQKGYFVAVFEDITERKQAEETLKKANAELKQSQAAYLNIMDDFERQNRELQKSRESLAKAQEMAQLGNWDWDVVSDEMYWSGQVYRIFGYLPKELMATYENLIKRAHKDDTEFVKHSFFQALFEKKELSIDYRVVLPDGTEKIVHLQGEVTFNDKNESIRLFGTIQDITERKKSEEVLKRAKEEAEEATRLKDKFVNLVAHDLRSPFASITGALKLLSDDPELKLNPDQRKLINSVLKSGDRMVSMIDEMLDISRLQTGKIQLKPRFFDGRMVVGAVLGSIIFRADEKGIEVVNEVPEGARLHADITLFSETISNLVSNAVKFCDKGDTVTLFIPPERPTTIAVKDTGSGIKESILPDLFKSEVKTTTAGSSGELGTGLGLPYSYEIMQAHGGDITVESVKGEGSVFYVELPYVKPRVMIVDDEKVTRQLLTVFLDDLDVEIIEAENGREALKAIEDHPPHVILSDIEMPVMDGFAFLKEIMGNDKTNSIPVIIVTGNTKMKIREKFIWMGASDFITKPIREEEFIPRIRRYII